MSTRTLWRNFLSLTIGCAIGLALVHAHAATEPKVDQLVPATQESPSIKVEEPTYDFGEALEGTEVEHDFVVTNNGGGVLQISQVRPG